MLPHLPTGGGDLSPAGIPSCSSAPLPESGRGRGRGLRGLASSVLLAALFLLAAGCSTEIRGVRVTARPATRIPATLYQDVDGTARLIPALDPEGNTIFFVVRARY
jgi:hypothetical protein